MNLNRIILFVAYMTSCLPAIAQTEQVEENYKDDLKFMIQSYETILNLLGDPDVSRQDKDQIINQSYLKLFDNNKVQIEDDLDPNRNQSINKDVQAYLQDVVFFYKNIQFTFEISEISKGLNDKDQLYYKVSMEERLEGVNLYGEPLKEVKPRYVELNLDEKAQEFKIVSVYTSKLSEKEDMANWFNQLDSAWLNYFAPYIFLDDSTDIIEIVNYQSEIMIKDTIITEMSDTIYFDSPSLYQSIAKILNWQQLVIQPEDSIRNLKPVSKFTKLESIDFSDCAIDDVSPLRSLLSLSQLNASGTLISSLNDLQFLSGLKKVNINNTAVYDLAVTSAWTSLENLSMVNSPLIDLSFLEELNSLKRLNLKGNKTTNYSQLSGLSKLLTLNLSNTSFKDIRSINNLKSLHTLYLDASAINSLNGISDSLKLEIISIDNTKISDLSPLLPLPDLKMIYCDNSEVSSDNVRDFISKREGVLIIYETKSLENWWLTLNENLKTFIRSRIDSITDPPQTEILHQIIFTESVNLSGQKTINSLEGFQKLINLKSLNIDETEVKDLSPLSGISQLTDLMMANTPVVDVSPLATNSKLSNLDIQNTAVASLSSLVKLQNLKLIKADSSGITQQEALDFMMKNKALLLYQSAHLLQWWDGLSDEWINFFSKKMNFNKNPSAEELQELVNVDSLVISDLGNVSLKALEEFKLLSYLKLDHMETTDLSPLLQLKNLTSLSINDGSVGDLLSIAKMEQLTKLDFSTTSLNDISFISSLTSIEILNISSTAVESLKPLVSLKKLRYLDISNTRIKKITYLDALPSMKELKLTNTDLNERKIDSYQKSHPSVKLIIY